MPVEDVQACLRQTFSRWGRPLALRVDNGSPWGSRSDLPSGLTLWLRGLGVEVSFIPPRQPQKNGVVERSQGVGKQWAEPHTCRSRSQLQRRLDRLDRLQRERYPLQDGRSRSELFPALKHTGRPYSRAWERRNWDWEQVLQFLAEHVVARKTDKNGLVSIYHRGYYLGRKHRNKLIHVLFDPVACEWVFVDEHDQQLRRQPATEVNPDELLNIHGARRRARPRGKTRRRN